MMQGAPNKMERLLAAGHFLLSAELTPPRHHDLRKMLEHAAAMSDCVDVVQLSDHLLSQARCSNLAAGRLVLELGLEPILQFPLRHKNRIAIQGDLLGMAALGMSNVIFLPGYPLSIGSDVDAKDVSDLEVPQALRLTQRMTGEGKLFNGDPLSPAPYFHVGTIDFPVAESAIPASMERLAGKLDAGASFVQVQAVFELAPMRRWMEAVVARGCHERAHFIAAVFPFLGVDRLRFLQKVPGLVVPDHLLARVSESGDMERESYQITLELIHGLRELPGLSGIHIRSIAVEDWVPRLVADAGLRGGRKR